MKYLFSYCCNYRNTVNELPDCELDGERLITKLSNYETTSYKLGSPDVLVDYINNINKVVKSTDTVLIQFSGHGTQIKSSLENDGFIEALVFWDGKNYYLLKDKDFIKLTDSIKCKTVVIFDSCFSGGFNALLPTLSIIRSADFPNSKLFNLELNYGKSMTKKCYLMSSSETETSESSGNGGLFTNAILESTKTHNKTINQIYKDTVNYCKGHQIPKLLLKGIGSNSKLF